MIFLSNFNCNLLMIVIRLKICQYYNKKILKNNGISVFLQKNNYFHLKYNILIFFFNIN